MTAFLLRRLAYLTVLVVIATVVAYFLAATQLNPRSRYEGRNPPQSMRSSTSSISTTRHP
jgi:peptide/nickel transport system permease protein